MAALRSLLRAHALDARRDGLLAPALLLLAAAPSAADARVLESGCAAILTVLRKWARRAARAATLCATGCSRTLPGCIPTHPGCNRTYPRCAALLAAHESAPLAQHTASASQAAGRGEAKEALHRCRARRHVGAPCEAARARGPAHPRAGGGAARSKPTPPSSQPTHNLNPPMTPTPTPAPKLTPASTPTAALKSNPNPNQAAERALALEPCHFGARAQRGAALRGLRRFGEALEAYEDAPTACRECHLSGATAHYPGLLGLTLYAPGYVALSRGAAELLLRAQWEAALRPGQSRRFCGSPHSGAGCPPVGRGRRDQRVACAALARPRPRHSVARRGRRPL
eukprot:scaffold71271_cov59-Phaeocystis_antarctica.AAC.2